MPTFLPSIKAKMNHTRKSKENNAFPYERTNPVNAKIVIGLFSFSPVRHGYGLTTVG